MLGVDGDLFHIGVRVTDIDAAMRELGRSHGVTWASVQDRMTTIWLPDGGEATFRLVLTYSCEGPVHIELMQGGPGSPWDVTDVAGGGEGVHHFGYWVDDVGAETERLMGEGWTLVLAAAPPEAGYGRFSYLRSPAGVLVEPLNRSAKARFEAWWAGGDLAAAPTR